MSIHVGLTPRTRVITGDLSEAEFDEFEERGRDHGLAVDIETTGLDLQNSSVQVVSIAIPGEVAVIAISDDSRPKRLGVLLENDAILKIFHNAVFDCSFLLNQWGFDVDAVFCTKVAARVASIERNPTLKSLVAILLGIEVDKTERLSDWRRRPLTDSQTEYAANDVRYLHELQKILGWRLADGGLTQLFEACMAFIPTRARLGILQLNDVFAYEID